MSIEDRIEKRFDDQVNLLRARIHEAFKSFEETVKKEESGVIGFGFIHTTDCPLNNSLNRYTVADDIDCICNARKVSFTINKDGLLQEKVD